MNACEEASIGLAAGHVIHPYPYRRSTRPWDLSPRESSCQRACAAWRMRQSSHSHALGRRSTHTAQPRLTLIVDPALTLTLTLEQGHRGVELERRTQCMPIWRSGRRKRRVGLRKKGAVRERRTAEEQHRRKGERRKCEADQVFCQRSNVERDSDTIRPFSFASAFRTGTAGRHQRCRDGRQQRRVHLFFFCLFFFVWIFSENQKFIRFLLSIVNCISTIVMFFCIVLLG